MELSFTLIALLSLAWVIGRLAVTVIPLQIKEARVVNGLAKLRRQMLISGVAVWLVAVFGFLMLLFSLFYPFDELFMEMLVISLTTSLVIVAETKHRIYHQQYTAEHKAISRKIQQEMDKKEAR
jgi:hypothetical protein